MTDGASGPETRDRFRRGLALGRELHSNTSLSPPLHQALSVTPPSKREEQSESIRQGIRVIGSNRAVLTTGAMSADPNRTIGEPLFDYRVGAAEQRDWEGEAERLGGPQIDDQLNLRCLHYRQVRRLLARG